MKKTWKKHLKQGTCISLAALLLVSQNGVINVKAADIEKSHQEETSVNKINNVDELATYLADEIKREYPEFRYVGWQDDLHDMNYFWQHTKTGKCISKIVSPSELIWGVIGNGTYNRFKKLGVNGLAKKIASKGVAWSLAVSVAKCYIENKGK